MMKKIFMAMTALSLLSLPGLASAAQPQELSDKAMDSVSAGALAAFSGQSVAVAVGAATAIAETGTGLISLGGGVVVVPATITQTPTAVPGVTTATVQGTIFSFASGS